MKITFIELSLKFMETCTKKVLEFPVKTAVYVKPVNGSSKATRKSKDGSISTKMG